MSASYGSPTRARRNWRKSSIWPPPPPLPKKLRPSASVRYAKGTPRHGDAEVLWHGNKRGPDGKRLGPSPARPRAGKPKASTIVGNARLAEGLAILGGAYQPGKPVDMEQAAQFMGGRMSDDELAAVIFRGTVADPALATRAHGSSAADGAGGNGAGACSTNGNASSTPSPTKRKRGRPSKDRSASPGVSGTDQGVPVMPRSQPKPPATPVGDRTAEAEYWPTDGDLAALPPPPSDEWRGDQGHASDGRIEAALSGLPVNLQGDAKLAVDALRQLAVDPRASGAARASAARSLLEIAGVLGKHQRPPPPPEDDLLRAGEDLATMSLAELKAFFLRCCGHELKELRAANYQLRQQLESAGLTPVASGAR